MFPFQCPLVILPAFSHSFTRSAQPPTSVLVKTFNKWCVANNKELRGARRSTNERPMREARIAQHLSDTAATAPHVTAFHGFFDLANSDWYVAVSEFASGGDLMNQLNNGGACPEGWLDEARARGVFRQMVDAVLAMHTAGRVVHLDISLENFVCAGGDLDAVVAAEAVAAAGAVDGAVDGAVGLRVIDFGVARDLRDLDGGSGATAGRMRRWFGKPKMAPPEMYDAFCYYVPEKCDVWSLGISLFAILFARLPFNVGATYADPFFVWMCGQSEGLAAAVEGWGKSGEIPQVVSPACLDLLKSMVCADPNQRLSMAEVRAHPWLQ